MLVEGCAAAVSTRAVVQERVEQERVEQERSAWREAAAPLDPAQFVFVDRSGPPP